MPGSTWQVKQLSLSRKLPKAFGQPSGGRRTATKPRASASGRTALSAYQRGGGADTPHSSRQRPDAAAEPFGAVATGAATTTSVLAV